MHEASKFVREEELIHLLLLNFPMRACSERMGLSYNTVRKYASDPVFLEKLKSLSGMVYNDVIKDLQTNINKVSDRMTELSDKALDVLEELMLDEKQKGITRIKAADSVLDRNSETARNKKFEGKVENHHSIDPVLLMHAAATAQEIEQAQQKRLPANTQEGVDAES